LYPAISKFDCDENAMRKKLVAFAAAAQFACSGGAWANIPLPEDPPPVFTAKNLDVCLGKLDRNPAFTRHAKLPYSAFTTDMACARFPSFCIFTTFDNSTILYIEKKHADLQFPDKNGHTLRLHVALPYVAPIASGSNAIMRGIDGDALKFAQKMFDYAYSRRTCKRGHGGDQGGNTNDFAPS
jgi:hypothetical protein